MTEDGDETDTNIESNQDTPPATMPELKRSVAPTNVRDIPFVPRRSPVPVSDEQRTALLNAGLNPWVAHAFALRGVNTPEDALGDYRLLPFTGPQGLKGITEMAHHLANAIQKQEKIMIVADYDCDGATACAIGVSGLRAMGANIDYMVPNRFKDGYGLTPKIVAQVAEHKPVWILTVDNGIASHAGIDEANRRGIKVLVTDHHLPTSTPPEPPAAVAIVNPNQHGCPFPSKALAGCGVMYYVLAGVRQELRARGELADGGPNLSEWLDIVALGTVADVVKLDQNNRWIVRKGLDRIRQGLVHPGIQALFDLAGRSIYTALSQNFGFAVGPRINAAGRLKDMSVGIQCLLAATYDDAMPLAEELNKLNVERKSKENQMKEEAWALIDLEKQDKRMTRVVFSPSFHEGVIGIVAGRIKEITNCPTIVFAPADGEPGKVKGSGRSIEGIHLRDVLDLVYKQDPSLLPKFGGHAMAAGLTIDEARLPEFKDAFDAAVGRSMGLNAMQKVLEVDGELPTHAITVETAYALEREPWGQGFPEPVWTGTFNVVESHLMGKDQAHLRMILARDGETFTAVQFFNSDLPSSDVVEIAYTLNTNEFRGNVSVQLMVKEKKSVRSA